MNYFVILIVAIAGAGLSVQAAANAELRVHFGNALPAAVISFVIGLIGLIAVTSISGAWSWSVSFKDVPWWAWIGAILGAFFLVVSAYFVRSLGTTLFFAIIIASQLGMALFIDHLGLFGQVKQELTIIRFFGASLLVLGALLIKL
jgi:transporter family-2 protein